MLYILSFFFIGINAFASSVFYEPEAKQEKNSGYNVKHKTSIFASVGGGNTSKQKAEPLHEFQKGRINLISLIEIEDKEQKHKAFLDLRLGTDQNEDQSTLVYINEGYIELNNSSSQALRAKIRFGLQNTAANALAVNSSTPMKNSQGVRGNWYRFVPLPVFNQNGGYNPTFILQNTSLIAQGFGDATFLYSHTNGVTNYVQPNPNWSATNVGLGFTLQRMAGLKAAFTYQPFGNSGNFNGGIGNSGHDRRGIETAAGNGILMKNIASFALNYLNEWRGVALNATLSGEMAGLEKRLSTVPIERNTIKQYTAGINISYIGFTLGGSYSYSGDSLLLKQNAGQVNSYAVNGQSSISTIAGLQSAASQGLLDYKSAYNYDVGLSYAFGAYQVGFAHNRSRFMNNNFNATIFSLSEDLKNTGGVKLTTSFEGGLYNFNSANYFIESGSSISIENGRKNRGYFGYITLTASI